MNQATLSPIEQEVVVRCHVDHAFEVFTARMGDWWPLATHSVAATNTSDRRPVGAGLEPRIGGRVYETHDDGSEHTWGTVTVWEPPSRLVIAWTVSDDGADTEIEVRFAPSGDATRVALTHRGWDTTDRRSSYARGWPGVLAAFAHAASGG